MPTGLTHDNTLSRPLIHGEIVALRRVPKRGMNRLGRTLVTNEPSQPLRPGLVFAPLEDNPQLEQTMPRTRRTDMKQYLIPATLAGALALTVSAAESGPPPHPSRPRPRLGL